MMSCVVAALVLTACAPEPRPAAAVVEIVGADYAFKSPPVVPAGRTTFLFGTIRVKPETTD